MKEAFRSKLSLNKANVSRLNTINSIIEEYKEIDLILTLRQLYYQLVSRDIIPNNQKEYAKLSVLLTKGRMSGIVDWEAIEDRGRQPKLPYYVLGVKDALRDTVEQYRLNRQQGQKYYVEVWVEKDALSNVFYRVTSAYHVSLMVNKGYSSSSAMYQAAKRFKQHNSYFNQTPVLLYFGDHDPSGKDMVRDIKERLNEMQVDIIVKNPALSMEQIKQYRPPENPAKIADPRAKEYILKYGRKSWELDALPPQILMQLVKDSITTYIDEDIFKKQLIQEAKEKKIIESFSDNYNENNYDFDNDIDLDSSEFDF